MIFSMHGYIKSCQIQVFTGDPQKRPQTKQVLQLQVLCNYVHVSKGNSNEAFPKSRYCSLTILSSFIKQVELCEGGYHSWFTCICWFEYVAKPSIEEGVIAIFLRCRLPL